jgi:hypothetical protein
MLTGSLNPMDVLNINTRIQRIRPVIDLPAQMLHIENCVYSTTVWKILDLLEFGNTSSI